MSLKPPNHARDHRPVGWLGSDDPGGADPFDWLTATGGHGPWITPTLVNGYTDVSPGSEAFQYRHAAGSPAEWEIEFRGWIDGPDDVYAWTFPAEDRPPEDKTFILWRSVDGVAVAVGSVFIESSTGRAFVGPAAGAAAAGLFGTALPGSPSDGQQFVYLDSLTAPTYRWEFRYNASSASSYKWEFVGGTPLRASVNGGENSSSTSYTDLATAGPAVTVPLAGDYDVAWGSAMTARSGTGVSLHSYAVGAGAASDGLSIRGETAQQSTGSRTSRETGLSASTAITSKYRVTGSTGTWEQRWLEVLPVRVA